MKHKLTIGQKAPSFESVDVFGKKISLLDYKTKHTLVVFLRYAGCPWCNLAIQRLVLEERLLKQSRCTVIAFIQSDPKNIITNIYQRHQNKPTFPIIADKMEKYYQLYGVTSSLAQTAKSITQIPHWIHAVKDQGFTQGKIDGKLLMVPAMFLISEGNQVILSANYQADFFNNETFSKIYERLTFGSVTTLGSEV